MTEPTFLEVERLAVRLCTYTGRDWKAKNTKRQHWRIKARAILECDPPAEPKQQPQSLLRRVLRWIAGGR